MCPYRTLIKRSSAHTVIHDILVPIMVPNSILEENFPGQNSKYKLNLKLDNIENHLAFKTIPKRKFSLSRFKLHVVLQCHHLPFPDVTFDLFLLPLLKGGKHAILCCREDAAYYVIYNACIIAFEFMRPNSIALYVKTCSKTHVFTCGDSTFKSFVFFCYFQ